MTKEEEERAKAIERDQMVAAALDLPGASLTYVGNAVVPHDVIKYAFIPGEEELETELPSKPQKEQ